MNFIGKDVSSRAFVYNAATKTFSTDASDIGNVQYSRLWNDSFDQGFRMTSAKTGLKVIFVGHNTVCDHEGDIACWEYRGYANGQEYKAVVFND